jgi:4-aminobutyrate aminotransferase-like enzyme
MDFWNLQTLQTFHFSSVVESNFNQTKKTHTHKKRKKTFENFFWRSLIFNGARNTHKNKRTRPLLTLQDHKLRSAFETKFSSSFHEHKAMNISTINKFYRLVNWR